MGATILHGLRSNLKSTKEIVERYNESIIVKSVNEENEQMLEPDEETTQTIEKGQKTLF